MMISRVKCAGSGFAQNFFELGKLFVVGQDAHNQQVSNFFEAEVVAEGVDQFVYLVPAIPQLARARSLLAVDVFRRDDLRNVRQTREDTFAASVAQAAFDSVLFVKRGVDVIVGLQKFDVILCVFAD